MSNFLKLTVVAGVLTAQAGGCHTCQQMTCGWFNRGDRCVTAPPDCPPGAPRATMMLPSSPQVLPGPIEIAPQP